MIKELSTMALVATITTTMTGRFDTVMTAVHDIASVYAAAGEHSSNPEAFLKSIEPQEKRLREFSTKVAALDLEKEMGPFGVPLKP